MLVYQRVTFSEFSMFNRRYWDGCSVRINGLLKTLNISIGWIRLVHNLLTSYSSMDTLVYISI